MKTLTLLELETALLVRGIVAVEGLGEGDLTRLRYEAVGAPEKYVQSETLSTYGETEVGVRQGARKELGAVPAVITHVQAHAHGGL